jgi:hypothetical protein
MNIDHFFAIGDRHARNGQPCQDYALSRMLADGACAYGAVGDGCSGVNADTDVGARAVCFAFEEVASRAVEQGATDDLFGKQFVSDLHASFARKMAFTGRRDDYHSTLVGLVATPERAGLTIFGDGAYIVKYRNGRYKLGFIEWLDNVPYYPHSSHHPDLYERFSQPLRTEPAGHLTNCWSIFEDGPDGAVELLEECSEPLVFSDVENGHVVTFKPMEEDIVALAIMTDGVSQLANVPEYEAAHTFMAFKTLAGQFVSRRMSCSLREYR